ncbi:ubiquitin-like-specific protease ESD4 [Trifolium pratense]|uniref:ubiquitin-like-specific protease ESD4 n=1 Tax=Trifolium pratense TaxID=57577 RepID=UPI001E690770|nr:ubiquitin-like-specific protease ESD4 [Trifolium pratense]
MAIITTLTGKRPHRWLYGNHNHQSPNSSRFKRQKLSTMSNNTPSPFSSTNATLSRISRYPETKPPLRREVHAPCSRPRKFDLSINSKSESSNLMVSGISSALIEKYQQTKYSALATIELRAKGKEKDNYKEVVSEDSSVEHELRYAAKDCKLKESDLVHLDNEVGVQKQSTSSVVSELSGGKLNEFDAAKMVGTLSLSPENDLSGVRAYKKLLEAVDKRSDTIGRLKFEIQLNEKRRSAFDLLRPKKELVEEVPWEPFVPLTKEEKVEVARAFSADRKKVLVAHEKSNIEISGEKFQCLRPSGWLNDEVINLYLELLKERERRDPQKYLNCHFFNTFFYKKLISGKNGYDYKSVRRWTTQKKLGYGLHECDKIFVPIHQQIHWCLAVINKKEKKLQYLDSLKGIDTQVLGVLARYFVDEVKDKTGEDIDISCWEKEFVEDLPEQKNGYDCGMYMVKYTDFYSRNLRLCFNQSHMPYFRLKTAKEILRLKAD